VEGSVKISACAVCR